MERPFAQFTADRAPTVEAIRDEKDPIVRLYLENLRRQVADIAAKYGVNARDVFRVDVQDRMEVDDFAMVAALVRRIGMFSGKEIPREMAREMAGELSRRERRAREIVSEELRRFDDGRLSQDDPEYGQVVSFYLRAGMPDEAVAFAERNGTVSNNVPSNNSILAEAYVTLAQSMPSTEHAMAERKRCYQRAMRCAKFSTESPIVRMRTLAKSYGPYVSTLSSSELTEETQWLFQEIGIMCLPLIDRLILEFEHRGIRDGLDDLYRERVRAWDEMGEQLAERSGTADLTVPRLILAEMDYAAGGTIAHELLRDQIDELRADADVQLRELNRQLIANTAGRIGAPDLLKALSDDAFWIYGPNQSSAAILQMQFAKGAMESGHFSAAMETVEGEGGPFTKREILTQLAIALPNADRLDLFVKLFPDPHAMETRPAIAARIRRGENLLDAVVDDQFMRDPAGRSLDLLSAGIATIGYTATMRKRLGV